MSTVKLGCQLFINRNDSCDQIRQWVDGMATHGFHYIRLFLSWDLVESSDGWHYAQFDSAFDQAAERDMEIVATLMSVSPPGWMRLTDGMQDVANLDDPELWSRSLRYIDHMVQRYAKHPALHSWILWNEPSRALDRNDPQQQRAFSQFLQEKYTNINALNECYFRQYEHFEQIAELQQQQAHQLEFKSYSGDVDWLEFTCSDLTHKLSIIAERCRRIDATHPIHINPHRISQVMSACGQDIWQQAQVCDFIGSSVHPAWHSTRFTADRIQQSVALFADMMRSATSDKNNLFWVTELQAGATIFSAFHASGPRPHELQHWIWESIGSGAEAILFWCYNDRDDGFEAGEWGLIQGGQQQSQRLQAISACINEIQRHDALLRNSKPHQGEIGILISSANWNLSFIEGEGDDKHNLRNQQMASDALCGAYALAQDCGFEVCFIHEDELSEKILPACLLLPSITALNDSSIDAIERFVDNGGHIIADGMFGWKQANGRLARARQDALAKLFGAAVSDIYGGSQQSLQFHEHTHAARLFEVAFNESDSCIARWQNQTPAILHKQHANAGSACRIGTVFFQQYFIEATSATRALFRDLLAQELQPPVQQAVFNNEIRLRRLDDADGEIVILINTGDPQTCQLNCHEHFSLFDCNGQQVDTQHIHLSQHQVQIMALRPALVPSPPSTH